MPSMQQEWIFRQSMLIKTECVKSIAFDRNDTDSEGEHVFQVNTNFNSAYFNVLIEYKPVNVLMNSISNIEDTLYQMNGATVFLKLDLTQSLHQIEHEESSRYNTTFVCHKGLYRYKRLMFRINSAPELHQRIIQQTILKTSQGVRT